jgi:large-conductance mechanosensitive channel
MELPLILVSDIEGYLELKLKWFPHCPVLFQAIYNRIATFIIHNFVIYLIINLFSNRHKNCTTNESTKHQYEKPAKDNEQTNLKTENDENSRHIKTT